MTKKTVASLSSEIDSLRAKLETAEQNLLRSIERIAALEHWCYVLPPAQQKPAPRPQSERPPAPKWVSGPRPARPAWRPSK